MRSTDARVAVLSVAAIALTGGAALWGFRTGPRVVALPPAADEPTYRNRLREVGIGWVEWEAIMSGEEVPFLCMPVYDNEAWRLARAADAAALRAGLRDPDANVRQGTVLVLQRLWFMDLDFTAVVPREELDALVHDPDPGVRGLVESGRRGEAGKPAAGR